MKIDVYNPDNYLNGIPHAQFQWLRENAPVHWHEPVSYTHLTLPTTPYV